MFHYQDNFSSGTDKTLSMFVVGAIILSIVLFVAGLVGGYYFDTIKKVPGNEHSVPAARPF